MKISRRIKVSFEHEGFHLWEDAPENRAYLRNLHRHIFKIEVEMQVFDHDREVEFHDLLDKCKSITGDGEQFTNPVNKRASCELHAEVILSMLTVSYPDRVISVTVSEDGECSSIITNE